MLSKTFGRVNLGENMILEFKTGYFHEFSENKWITLMQMGTVFENTRLYMQIFHDR